MERTLSARGLATKDECFDPGRQAQHADAYRVQDRTGLTELAGSLDVAAGYSEAPHGRGLPIIKPQRIRFRADYRVVVWPVADDEFRPTGPLDVPEFHWPPAGDGEPLSKFPMATGRGRSLDVAADLNRQILATLTPGACPVEWASVLQLGDVLQHSLAFRLADDLGIQEHRQLTAVRIVRPTSAEQIRHAAGRAASCRS